MAKMPFTMGQKTGHTKQDRKILLCSLKHFVKFVFGLLAVSYGSLLFAIPANYPITNTATVEYQVGATLYSVSDSDTQFTDAGAGNSPPHGITLPLNTVAENQPVAVARQPP